MDVTQSRATLLGSVESGAYAAIQGFDARSMPSCLTWPRAGADRLH